MKGAARQRFDKALERAQEDRPKQAIGTFGGMWKGMTKAGADWSAKTEISHDLIRKLGERGTSVPPDFNVNPKIQKNVLDVRRQMSLGKLPVDWGCGEMFALGSLLLEGTPIRFVGQDAQRGTFSHRHACLHDVVNGRKHYPLQEMDPGQAPIAIVNTMLSELAVLGFEYGFSSADPRNLVLWEAQFGDFVNGAQPIIDQFIVAAESKWQKMCGLVMLLPHGYEGQGPEHSYAYLDRFLALCAENNIQVAQPSLPSQYFHILRRQMKRSFRKPLVLMMPKSLLRAQSSSLEEFTSRSFQLVLDDPANPNPQRVRRVLFCSGKIYFTLDQARKQHKLDDVALVRVEQFYPFPEKEIRSIFAKYRGATEIAWVQDEPENRGAWRFMDAKLRKILPENRVLTYYGRDEAASPATGAHKMHEIEEQELLAHALELPAKEVPPESPPERVGGSSVPVVGGPKPGSSMATADKGSPVSD
jgi:2-oxoglutarate dehydrogenase complex dehydrogenase (E1) component-like enzyme